jgi:hypothetical protein
MFVAWDAHTINVPRLGNLTVPYKKARERSIGRIAERRPRRAAFQWSNLHKGPRVRQRLTGSLFRESKSQIKFNFARASGWLTPCASDRKSGPATLDR